MFIFLLLSFNVLNLLSLGTHALECSYVDGKQQHHSEDKFNNNLANGDGGQVVIELASSGVTIITTNSSHEQCDERSVCFAYWSYHPQWPHNVTLFKVIGSGCMNTSGDNCNNSQCLMRPHDERDGANDNNNNNSHNVDKINNTLFCCCKGDHCNSKPILRHDDIVEDFAQVVDVHYQGSILFLLLLASILFLIFVIVLTLRVVSWSEPRKQQGMVFLVNKNPKAKLRPSAMDSVRLLEASHSRPIATTAAPSPILYRHCGGGGLSLDELTFGDIIVRGKFATVWKVQRHQQQQSNNNNNNNAHNSIVAVKVFGGAHHKYLLNECAIYSLPFMAHPSLPQYFGHTERLTEVGAREYCLAIEYAANGSLRQYLQHNRFDWTELCRLLGSLVRGVAYLHTEVFNEGRRKPAVAHRDLTSTNVLVKADGSCMIGDFKHAVQFNNHHHHHRIMPVEVEHGGGHNVTYLAPELFDGGLNHTQLEAACKQADVYALALIMWEIATRCTDLYQGIEVPAYREPFAAEMGANGATIDQMRVLVSRNKARPLFPEIWKDSNQAIRLLKETIAECWDHEPEARLTALCIEERMLELPSLWKRYKKETLSNCCVISSMAQEKGSDAGQWDGGEHHQHRGHHQHEQYCGSDDEEHHHLPMCYINQFENSRHWKCHNYYHLLNHPHQRFYPKTTTTMLVNGGGGGGGGGGDGADKDNRNVNLEKNLLLASNQSPKSRQHQPQELKFKLPLQPHQARNPCTERNLFIDTIDETERLLEQGLKFQNVPQKSNIAGEEIAEVTTPTTTGETRTMDDSHSASTIRPPLPTPISYVRNLTSANNGSENERKKDTNMHSNKGGIEDGMRMITTTATDSSSAYRLKFWNMFRRKIAQLSSKDVYLGDNTQREQHEDIEARGEQLTSKCLASLSSDNIEAELMVGNNNNNQNERTGRTTNSSVDGHSCCSASALCASPSPMISSNCDLTTAVFEHLPNNQLEHVVVSSKLEDRHQPENESSQ